ncbi:AarF/ABC1/UbiB kinase family protein [Moraxella nasibovis]|uniref:ABC1 kinase family protein n=1 Tax=Moraxella nasibovis TaxID=2904120 RepID=UPI00240F1D89|nr:AarF/ABC1/UbiB kinase family protein [Moraxella nasibovis]WFF39552.1 AarF/ABC1/UbiB kinase family protein [Moraxella nasibovis]
MLKKPTRKSPFAIAKKSVSTSLNVLGRIQKTASVAGLSALRVATGEKMDAELLKESFEQMGVTYIKLGQFIASTPSIFPKDYVLAFQDCLDATTPVPFNEILAVLREELGQERGLGDIFEHIDPKPLASASIAQVHRATLIGGRQVALKVQKPNVGTVIHTDLSVLHGGFWLAEKLVPSMKAANLAPILDEIRSRMMMETDFLAESRHIERFLGFLKQTGNTKITAPTVHQALTTKRVLTMDLLVGKSLIDETLGLAKDEASARQTMSDVLDTWFLSLMMTGEFHADLHAGNLMMLDDGRIAFLDFGLVGQIEPKSLQACFALVQSLQVNDYQGMAKAMVEIGMTHDKVSIDRLGEDLHRMLGKVGKDSQPESLNAMMLELSEIGKRHGIHFPRDFALLLKQLLYFDRFMVTLAPEMELFEGERLKMVG